jgi:hypothetical protein
MTPDLDLLVPSDSAPVPGPWSSSAPHPTPEPVAPLWYQSVPCAIALVVLAIAALAAVWRLDSPLLDAAQTSRVWTDYRDATQALAVVEKRLGAIQAKLAKVDKNGPTTPQTSLWMNEEVNLERQQAEFQERQRQAAQEWRKTFKTAIDLDTPPAGLFGHLLDRSTYAHAAFHTMVVSTIGTAFVSIAAALLLILGKFYQLELKDILGFVKDHLPTRAASSAVVAPLLGAMAGAGVLTAGAAAGLSTSTTLQPFDASTSRVQNTSYYSNQVGPTQIGTLGPMGHGWVVQPVVERYRERVIDHEGSSAATLRQEIAVQVKGEVAVAGQSAAFRQIAEELGHLRGDVAALNETAAGIKAGTQKTVDSVDAVRLAVDGTSSAVQDLQARTTRVADTTQDTSLSSAWLVDREFQKANAGFGGRLKRLFVGVKPLQPPPVSLRAHGTTCPQVHGCPATSTAALVP